jgi:hypothetical protein
MNTVPTTHDRSGSAPRLRVDLNLGTLDALPDWSTGPRGPREAVFEVIRATGFEGVQGGAEDVHVARALGLGICTSARVDASADCDPLARKLREQGFDGCTLHVGTGFEDDEEADALLDAICNAADRHGFPLFVETHRATITQDCWRTLQFVARHPRLRINGDFSHWYTGLEMVYGNWETKLSRLRPVFDRVRFIHGRIGSPGCMQVDVGDGTTEGRSFIGHFRQLWVESFRGFLRSAVPGDYICFAPELLPPRIHYARTFNAREECDRWQQAIVLARLARECFAEAQAAFDDERMKQ